MNLKHLVLIVLTAVFATACASKQARTDTSDKTAPAKAAPATAAPAKESAKKEAPQGVIIGKPAPGSKFAKLKIGMTLSQVEKTIGHPTKQWTHPTGKASIQFYYGPDRWVIQYSYKGEGGLTFNSGEKQLLTQIEVNKAE